MEIWKDIKDYENYQVSNLGRVKSLPKLCGRSSRQEKILKPEITKYGYLKVSLYKNGKVKRFFIHRIVAIAFIDNPNNLPCVNHIDGDKHNNNINNLEWCTVSENNKHAYRTGLKQPAYKPVIAINLQTGKQMCFESQHEAARQLDLYVCSINNVLKGRYKRTGNYTFKYVDNK